MNMFIRKEQQTRDTNLGPTKTILLFSIPVILSACVIFLIVAGRAKKDEIFSDPTAFDPSVPFEGYNILEQYPSALLACSIMLAFIFVCLGVNFHFSDKYDRVELGWGIFAIINALLGVLTFTAVGFLGAMYSPDTFESRFSEWAEARYGIELTSDQIQALNDKNSMSHNGDTVEMVYVMGDKRVILMDTSNGASELPLK